MEIKISKDLKNTQMYKALVEFDEEFGKLNNKKPMSLNVIGGFALIVPGIRKGDYTDIDYAGKDFPEKVKELVDKIGMKYNLGRGFINNDCLVTGTTLEDMEYATGPLTFSHGFDLKYITVNILVPKDVLKMKMIAIDTSYMGMDLGGEFTRLKDFGDIAAICEEEHLNIDDVVDMTKDYILCPEIYTLLNYYLQTKDDYLFESEGKLKKILTNSNYIYDAYDLNEDKDYSFEELENYV